MKTCYFYKCKYNTSGCYPITEEEYNKSKNKVVNTFEGDKNIGKVHSVCHSLPAFLNSVFILLNNK